MLRDRSRFSKDFAQPWRRTVSGSLPLGHRSRSAHGGRHQRGEAVSESSDIDDCACARRAIRAQCRCRRGSMAAGNGARRPPRIRPPAAETLAESRGAGKEVLEERFIEKVKASCLRETGLEPGALACPPGAEQEEAARRWNKQPRDVIAQYDSILAANLLAYRQCSTCPPAYSFRRPQGRGSRSSLKDSMRREPSIPRPTK